MPRSAQTIPERIDKYRAAAILSCSPRSVVDLACSGRLPGAAKIVKEWTFDEAKLREYVRQKEIEACLPVHAPPKAAIGVVQSFGRVLVSTESKSVDRLKQRMRRLQKSVALNSRGD